MLQPASVQDSDDPVFPLNAAWRFMEAVNPEINI